MANKQYEYFGNQNPTMNGRMMPARMHAQNAANIAADAKNWSTDPWFTLGATIGQAWADRYNERGVQKGRGEMQTALNNYLQQNGGDRIMPNIDVPEQQLNGSAQIEGGVLGGAAIADPKTVRSEYINNMWDSKYGNPDSDNPDKEKLQVKNDIKAMGTMGNNIDFNKVNKDDAREAVRQQLEANGRTPFQIDQVLAQFESTYDNKENKWKEQKATDLIDKGRQAASEGRWDDAQNFYEAAAEYNPKKGALKLQGLQGSYNRKMQAQQQRDKEFMAGYMRDANGNLVINPSHPIWSSRKYGGGGGSRGGSRSGGSSSATTSPDGRWIGRKDAVSHQDHADALAALKYFDGLEELSPSQKEAYRHAQDTVNRYNSQNHGGVRGYNIDSAEDVENYIRGVAYNVQRNPNASGTDILNTLRKDGIMSSPYWDDRYLEMLGLSADGNNND